MIDPRDERVDVRLRRAIESGSMPKELLVCGPAGTGKTYSILSVIHTLARDVPNLRILFLRATRVSLTESVLVTYEQEILPADGCEGIAAGAGRSHRGAYSYPNGTQIVVRGLDRNPASILSTVWDIVFANEAIEFNEEAWETIVSRMGRPGRDSRLGWMIADTNPSYPDHWLKKRADSGAVVLWDTSHRANVAMHDGRDWTAVGRAYMASLDKLTGPRRKRLKDGVWAQGDGIWFDNFDPEIHVDAARAEYNPFLRTYCAIDTGLETGAVWFQVRDGSAPVVTVFDDYFAYHLTPERNASNILAKMEPRGPVHRYFSDPAGDSRNASGIITLAEYERVGVRPMERWPRRNPTETLIHLETFVGGDGNPPRLFIHPRCRHLISAMSNYVRHTDRSGRMLDVPKDPQHPAEELVDSLRCGLVALFPEGRAPKPTFQTVHASRIR